MDRPTTDPDSKPTQADAEDPRRTGRIRSKRLMGRIGSRSAVTIVDISATGAQVEVRGWGYRVGDGIWMALERGKTKVDVRARVVWVRKAGFLRRRMGVAFEGLDEDTAAAIRRMAIHARNSQQNLITG